MFALNLPKNQLTQMTEEALDELYRRLNEEFHIKPEDCPIFYLYDRDFLSYKRNELRKKYVMRYTDPYGDEDGNLGQLWIVTWRVRKLTGFSFYSRMLSENGRSVYDMEQKFFICEHCGKIVALVKESGAPLLCCGQEMKELIPGTTEAAAEKHLPVYTVENNKITVTVGEVLHPMLPEHYIEWISLQTKQGNQRKALKPGDKPEACFAICEGDEVVAVYAYCNLHSLWKTEGEEKKQEEAVPEGNYIVCKCKNVSYYDILDEVHKHSNMHDLLNVFEDVKNTTNCSTGCGGCYEKVMNIISETIMGH